MGLHDDFPCNQIRRFEIADCLIFIVIKHSSSAFGKDIIGLFKIKKCVEFSNTGLKVRESSAGNYNR